MSRDALMDQIRNREWVLNTTAPWTCSSVACGASCATMRPAPDHPHRARGWLPLQSRRACARMKRLLVPLLLAVMRCRPMRVS